MSDFRQNLDRFLKDNNDDNFFAENFFNNKVDFNSNYSNSYSKQLSNRDTVFSDFDQKYKTKCSNPTGSTLPFSSSFGMESNGIQKPVLNQLNQTANTQVCQKQNPYLQPIPYQLENDYFNESHQHMGTVPHHQANQSQLPKAAIPEKYRSIFEFNNFNKMQSESFDKIFKCDDNCVISSPTGSGKTVLFELAIIKLLISKSTNEYSYRNSKVLYIAPTKALCTERYEDWCSKFQNLNCSVGLLTSDTGVLESESVKRSDIIICTPEKWDVLTRRWFDYSKLFDLIRLLLIDEIHTLKENRGTTLEVVTTRMKTMAINLRIVALSATVPNIEDISRWLMKKGSNKVNTLIFGDEYRSVKLEKTVYGYKTAGTSNEYQFDTFLNNKLVEVLKMHSKGKPVLVFCPTRQSCISTAKFLSLNMKEIFSNFNRIGSNTNKSFPTNKELMGLIDNGISYHHAGLGLNDRKLVEDGYKSGSIKVLCSTSTLAVGVNLPAYLVVIKGTKAWTTGVFDEYPELDVLQMMGRAGRPQFETEGACVILTDGARKEKYQRLVKGLEKLESSLHRRLHEHVTAEISLGTITSIETALEWLQSTFFYQRYLRNPTAYSVVNQKVKDHYDPEVKLSTFMRVVIDELIVENMVTETNLQYQCTKFGAAMAKHYVQFETMKLFIKSEPHLSLSQTLRLVAESSEFKEIRLKHTEKKLYKEINSNHLILFPVKDNKVERNSDKISLLMQYEFGGVEYPIYSGAVNMHATLLSDKKQVFRNCPRITKAVIDVFVEKQDSKSLLSSLQLYRCISGKCWENSSMVLKQLEGVGVAYVRKLANQNITSFDQIVNLPREKIEYYLGLKPGGGVKFVERIKKLPRLKLVSRLINSYVFNKKLKISFTVDIVLENPDEVGYFYNGSYSYINVVTEFTNTSQLIDFRRLPLKKIVGRKSFTLSVEVKSPHDSITIYINCDELAGVGRKSKLDLSSISQSDVAILPKDEVSESEFEFSDDETEMAEILNARASHHSTETTSGVNDSTFTRSHDKRDDGKFECNHKCKNKDRCRHLCCKEGIEKRAKSAVSCNHACKDKTKCRHLCCRESMEAEREAKKQPKITEVLKSDSSTFIKDDSEVDPNDTRSKLDILFGNSSKETTSLPKFKPMNKNVNSMSLKITGKKTKGIRPKEKENLLDMNDSFSDFDDNFDDVLDRIFIPARKRLKIEDGKAPNIKKVETKSTQVLPLSDEKSVSHNNSDEIRVISADLNNYSKDDTASSNQFTLDTGLTTEENCVLDKRGKSVDELQAIDKDTPVDETLSSYNTLSDGVLGFLGSDVEIE